MAGPARSEIRDSDIIALADRVTREGYRKYLRRLTLVKIRGFNDRRVSFDFPITVLIWRRFALNHDGRQGLVTRRGWPWLWAR